MLDENPYASPLSLDYESSRPPPTREQTQQQIRRALVILLVAGLFNYFCFAVASRRSFLFALLDLGSIALLCINIWFWLLPLLEWTATQLHRYIAPQSDKDQWHSAIYSSFKSAHILAFLGALLWIAWVIGFYFLRANFFVISYAVGIPAHLLAAMVYLPLIWRWAIAAGTKAPAPSP